jgi:predicted RNase H-like HicB family nuclease
MTWQALVEEWTSESIVYVPALPGFFAKAETSEEALETAERAILPFVAWLVEDELLESAPETGPIVVVERLKGTNSAGPIFEADKIAVDPGQVELGLAVGRAALSDLLYHFDDLEVNVRPAAERMLRHVAELDRWYAMRLLAASGRPFASVEDELIQSASLFEETIDIAIESGKIDDHEIDGEWWSVPKAIRRRTAHLREHLADLLVLGHAQ